MIGLMCSGRRAAVHRGQRLANRPAPLLALAGAFLLLAAFTRSLPADSTFTAPAPRYLIDAWPGERGLPQSIVTGVAQTPDGYLWVSTLDGLARFDGVRFQMFKAGNTPALGSGRIRFLIPGRNGALWICIQEGGVVRYEGGRFTPLPLPEPVRTRSSTVQVAEDNAGDIWLSAEDGQVGRLSGVRWTPVSTSWVTAERASFQVRADAAGQLWAASRSGLFRVEAERLVPAVTGVAGDYAVYCPGKQGGWWIGTAREIRLWRDGQWSAIVPSPGTNAGVVRCSLEDSAGNLWLGSQGQGLFRCDTQGGLLRFTKEDGLSSDSVRSLCEDNEGNLWVGTEGGGLNRLRLALFTVYGPDCGLPLEHLTSVSAGPGSGIWVGTDGAGVKLLRDGKGRPLSDDPSASPLHAMAVLADRQGQVWAGTRVGGVFRYHDGQMTRVGEGVRSGLTVRCLFEDSHSRIWVGWRNTPAVGRIEGGRLVTIPLPASIGAADIRAIAEDATGALWFGTDGSGLLRLQDGSFTRYTRAHGLGSDFIWALQPERNGVLWVGTYGGGLSRLKDGRAVNCTTLQGLADDVIGSIADDGLGQYWFSSNQGIFRTSKAELNEFAEGRRAFVQCTAYGKSDGMPALQCWGGYQPVATRTPDGRLWFITVRGLVSVNPAEVRANTAAPSVQAEELIVDGRVIDLTRWRVPGPAAQDSAARRPPLELPPGGRLFEFRYTALNFTAPNNVRFRHKLEGVDAEWVDSGTRRSAGYSRLARGNYTFWVQACNREGAWSLPGSAVAFTILPCFWQTGWFMSLFLLTFGSLVAWGVGTTVKWRHQRHLQLVERLHQLERERVRVARDIHDDLGSSLTEIGYLGALAVRDAKSLGEARGQIERIMDRTRDLASKLDETVWAVNPKNDSSRQLVTYLSQFTREFLGAMNLRCRLDLPADLPEVELTAESRHNVFLAVKEALNNAARHAAASEVRVRLAVAGETLLIEVSDNGRGLAAVPAREEGNGLRNMAARMKEIGGQFEVRSGTGPGTTVCLRLPLPPGTCAAQRAGEHPSHLGDARQSRAP